MGSFMGSLFSTVHRFIGLAQDLRSGIPICNLARVKCRDLDLEKSDELQKLGKNKAPSCAKLRQAAPSGAAAPKRVVRLVTRHI